MRLAPLPAPPAPLPLLARARALHTRLALDGGFTLDAHDRPARSGLAVCAEPGRTLGFPLTAWNDEVVARWLARNGRLRGHRHLGGWRVQDRGWVCLDVVVVLPSGMSGAAHALARRHGQAAVYDLARRRLVPVGP